MRYVAMWNRYGERPFLQIYKEIRRKGCHPYYYFMDNVPYDEIKFLRRTNKDGLIGSIVKWKGEKVKIIE